jgi:hypothetical protein
MGMTVYLQKFVLQQEAPIAFRDIHDFLSSVAEPNREQGECDIVFAPDRVADYASITGDPVSGALLVAFHRPIVDDSFRDLIFEAMHTFELCAYDDVGDFIYSIVSSAQDIPAELIEGMACSVKVVESPVELWATDAGQ